MGRVSVKKALTASSVESFKPPKTGQIEIFDAGYPGLSLRVSYGGRKTFSAFYRLHGKLHRLSLGGYPATSLAEAREGWREVRRAAAQGRNPGVVRPTQAATTFDAVVTEWLARDQAGNKSFRIIERMVSRELLPRWSGRQIGDIGRRDVRDLIDSIVDRDANTMARRVHQRVHRLFTWAVGRDIITTHPMVGLPM